MVFMHLVVARPVPFLGDMHQMPNQGLNGSKRARGHIHSG